MNQEQSSKSKQQSRHDTKGGQDERYNQFRLSEEITDKQVQDRLIYRDTTLKSIILRYCEMMNAEDGSSGYVEDILKDINYYEFQIAKASRTVQTLFHDRRNLQVIHEGVQKKIKSSSEDIEQLKVKFDVEEQIKNNRLTFETVSSQIMQYDNQEEVQKKIDLIIDNIDNLNKSHCAKMKLIKQKEKQLSLLLHTLHELTEDQQQ